MIGCKYCDGNTVFPQCKIIHKPIEGFIMCEVDWESCPDYQKALAAEKQEQELLEQKRKEFWDDVDAHAPKREEGESEEDFEYRQDMYYSIIELPPELA